MTPHHLHALAAAWSLHTARTALAVHVGREARHNGHQLLDAAPVLRSCSAWDVRHGVGGHGDPTSGAVDVLSRPHRETTWAERQATADRRLRGIGAMLRIDDPSPLGRIIEMVPRILPGTAAVLARHLADEDALLRRPDWLDLPPARQPLPGVACPHCGERQLVVQTAGPVDAWTVICATGRLCAGEGCPCGMPGAVEGVAHIWPRAAVIAQAKAKPGAATAAPGCKSLQPTAGAVAGAAPTTTDRTRP